MRLWFTKMIRYDVKAMVYTDEWEDMMLRLWWIMMLDYDVDAMVYKDDKNMMLRLWLTQMNEKIWC